MSTTDPTASPAARAAELLAKLTLDQKMAQVGCYFAADINETSDFAEMFPHGVGQVSALEARSAVTLDEVADFQRTLQEQAMAASGHGIPAVFHMEGLCGAYLPGATAFPSGIGRGSTWDPALEREIGEIVGAQERALGITQTLAPVLDITRDPRMGRMGECYGEDATLAAAMGTAFTRGIQDDDGSGTRSEAVAKHFLASHHTEGGIHGAHCNVPERLLHELYAKPFQAAITEANLRGVMPSYNAVGGEPMSASRRLLHTVLREQMGFDGVLVSDYVAVSLLHSVQKVAPTLAHAGLAAMSAGMDVEAHQVAGFGRELRDWFADGRADVAILDRAVLRVLTAKFRMGLFEHPFAMPAEVAARRFGTGHTADVALRSARESLVLLKNDGTLPIERAPRTIAVIGPHAATARSFFGGYSHYSMAEGKLAVNSSMAGLATKASDLKEITDTVPGTAIEASDAPAFEQLMQRHKPGIRTLLDELRDRFPTSKVRWARGYGIAGADTSGYAEALAAAEGADLVIMTLGGKYGTASIASTGEGIDTTDINLPPGQDGFIEAAARLGTPLLGIHFDGRPISSDVADANLAAIIEAWSPGESGAQAIVDVLTGTENPSGRLPVSIAYNAGQVPIYYNHPNGSAWHQSESVGFPDYLDRPHTPRYHFGHGLSYTAFEYTDLTIGAEEVCLGGMVDLAFTLTNTGNRTGTEVVQLYVSDAFASMSRPVQELAGFKRVTLEPGESQAVTFSLDVTQLAFLDADMAWRVEEGEHCVAIGSSSADARLRGAFTVTEGGSIDGARRGFYAR